MDQPQDQGSLLNKVYAMQCAQQQPNILTVVGGRVISRAAPMPLNGQQLMMQLDSMTSAMTGLAVEEEMEEVGEVEETPYSQAGRRRDPVYLASMAAHSLPSPQVPGTNPYLSCTFTQEELERHHMEQLAQQQQQQQQLEQQQLEYQLQLLQLQHQQHHQHQMQHQQQVGQVPSDHQVPEMETGMNLSLPLDSEFHCGSGRVLKRPDLLPMGNFF